MIDEGHELLLNRNDENRDMLEMLSLDMESERIQRHMSFQGMRLLEAANMLRSRFRYWGDLLRGDASEMSLVLITVHERARQLEELSQQMKKKSLDLAMRSLRPPSQSCLRSSKNASARRDQQLRT